LTDALERLKHALQDRCTIERELGAGGMATVYLAEDLKHDPNMPYLNALPHFDRLLDDPRWQDLVRGIGLPE
jgi:serine/threonine-protein kinase